MTQRIRDVRAAVTTVPTRNAWQRCAFMYALFLACALPVGALSGLLHPAGSGLSPAAAAAVAVSLLLHPAISEELIFRGLLLPRRTSGMPRGRVYISVVVALVAYVAAHPLNARLFWPASLVLFANPFYLVIVALLGLTCSAAYLLSGSLWPPILLHWVTVVLWILVLNGHALLTSFK